MSKAIKVCRAAYLLILLLVCDAEVYAATLKLQEVIQLTISSHPSIQSQLRLLESARADVSTARQQFFPTPSFGVEQVRSNPSDSLYKGNANLYTYRLQQPLWTGGRLTASLEKSKHQLQLVEASVIDTQIQLSLRSIQSWSELYSATLKLEAVNASVATHEKLVQQVKRRVDEGAAASSDLVLTQGRLAQVSSSQQALAAQARAARLKVSQLIGKTIGEDVKPTDGMISLVGDLIELEVQALERSPALKKLEAQQQIHKAEIREKKAEVLPEIYMRVEHQRSDYDNRSMVSNAVNRIYFGISSRFGAGLSSITQQESLNKRLESIEADTEAVRRDLIEKIHIEYDQWSSLKKRIPELERAMHASKRTAESWDRQFLAGRKSWMEVMNTARELMQAEMELADARSSLVNTEWRLSVLGYGIEKTLRQENFVEQSEIHRGE